MMMIADTYYEVTPDNLELVRENVPAIDQAERLEPGCETWGIIYRGGQRGQMTRWPDGRGAVCWGGDSDWGEWLGDDLHLDNGGIVDEDWQIQDD